MDKRVETFGVSNGGPGVDSIFLEAVRIWATTDPEVRRRVLDGADDFKRMVDGSFVTNCVITARRDDGAIFNAPDGIVKLDRYRVVPLEDYVAPDGWTPGERAALEHEIGGIDGR